MQAFESSLFEAGVQQVVEWVIGGIIAIAAALLTTALVRRGEIAVTATSGRTRQSPEVFVVGLLCAAVAIAAFLWGVLEPSTLRDHGQAMAWAGLLFGFTLGFVVMSIYAQHVWTWDETGLSWRGAFRRTSIRWSELARVGRAWDGQFFARDIHGRTVRWTTYTLQHQALNQAAQAALQAKASA
ncbi:MAG: hypothetical protein ABUL55_00800 [Pseudomonadota bacterium]